MHFEYAKLVPMPEFKQEFDEESHYNLIEHGDKILQAYDNLDCELRLEEKKNHLEHMERVRCFESKECAFCGGRLKYVDIYGGFWGCENYKTIQGSHMTFSGKYPIIKPRVDVPRDILSYILKQVGLVKKIKHKPLYEFIIATRREDLRIRYGLTSTENTFNGFQKGKTHSLEQERIALKYLRGIWDIVIPQQCIEYKYFNRDKKICIPDFICSNQNEVKIVDAKLFSLNDTQIDLYVSVVRHILQTKSDSRTVSGAYIVYDEDFGQYHPSTKYPIIRI